MDLLIGTGRHMAMRILTVDQPDDANGVYERRYANITADMIGGIWSWRIGNNPSTRSGFPSEGEAYADAAHTLGGYYEDEERP